MKIWNRLTCKFHIVAIKVKIPTLKKAIQERCLPLVKKAAIAALTNEIVATVYKNNDEGVFLKYTMTARPNQIIQVMR